MSDKFLYELAAIITIATGLAILIKLLLDLFGGGGGGCGCGGAKGFGGNGFKRPGLDKPTACGSRR